MMKVLFICSGNTCRSPMAEVLLRNLINKNGMSHKMAVSSAGLTAYDGLPASPEARQTVKKRGMSLVEHKARRLAQNEAEQADVILTMTNAHKNAILALWPQLATKVYSISEFAGVQGDIADPFGQGVEKYQLCAEQLDKLIVIIYEKLANLAG